MEKTRKNGKMSSSTEGKFCRASSMVTGKVKKHNNKNYNVLLNNKYFANLVPRFSPTCRETLVGSGHVSPRIWEITNKRLGEGADKCEICLYKA